jgi:hypothetical protein
VSYNIHPGGKDAVFVVPYIVALNYMLVTYLRNIFPRIFVANLPIVRLASSKDNYGQEEAIFPVD